MKIPFSVDQFFTVFESYNNAIWPAQAVAYLLGLAVIFAVARPGRWYSRIVSLVLAAFWLWIGSVYHIMYFSDINPVARIFGIFFVVEGILFLLIGVVFDRLSFQWSTKATNVVGTIFIAFSMIVYPLIGMAFGHIYPRAPMFGVTPCPAIIFTFGVLLWTTEPIPGYLLIIPMLWSFIGMSAAIDLHVPQDYGLVVTGVIGTVLIMKENNKIKKLNYSDSSHKIHKRDH